MDAGMDLQAGSDLVGRLEQVATLLERTLGWLEERHESLASAVEKISATVETIRREEELEKRLAEARQELAELRAASADTGRGLPRALEPLRRTLPTATAEMLAKHGIGESAVDVRTLDAALLGLSLEQRIAVKSQLRRVGAMA